MRSEWSSTTEAGRVQLSGMATKPGDLWGHFEFPALTNLRGKSDQLFVMVAPTPTPEEWRSYGWEPPMWEHVSVSVRRSGKPFPRCPTWEEMCGIKSRFWAPEECVIQFHPPKSEYVDVHRHCLHLWKPIGFQIPTPPKGTIA